MDDLPNLVGHHLGEELGSGGMGVVRTASDEVLGREVAVKVLHPELRGDRGVVERFISEARLAAGLEHPNILPVYAVGTIDDQGPLFTMKRVQGQTLHDRMREIRGTPKGEELDGLVDLLVKLCDALAYAHSRGVVHGDLKPQNVMLGEYDAVYLMDWGNARPIGSHAPVGAGGRPLVLGTPAIMAPEQARADVVDWRTDVFGLGAMLYTILARRVPYGRGGHQGRVDAAREGRRTPLAQLAPKAPSALREIAEQAMRHDPDERFQSTIELKHALLQYSRRRVPAPRIEVAPGDVLIREGDDSSAVYIAISGRFAVSHREGGVDVQLGECGPGSVLGEIGLLAGGRRSATVVALEKGELYALDTHRVKTELERAAPWMQRLVDSLARRLHEQVV